MRLVLQDRVVEPVERRPGRERARAWHVALDRGAPVRGWLEGAAVADAVDFVATLAAGDSIPRRSRRSVLLIAAASAVSCALLSRALETPPAEHEVFVTEAHLTGHP